MIAFVWEEKSEERKGFSKMAGSLLFKVEIPLRLELILVSRFENTSLFWEWFFKTLIDSYFSYHVEGKIPRNIGRAQRQQLYLEFAREFVSKVQLFFNEICSEKWEEIIRSFCKE